MSERPPQAPFRVVCLCASAGGLEPYVEILSHIEPDTGMVFIVAQHRAPTLPKLLPNILDRATALPVVDIEQGMPMEPNTVYIAPPRTEVSVERGVFFIRNALPPTGYPKTITKLLKSLSDALGSRTIGVILSGLDSDGAASLEDVKIAGGITMAQADAQFDGMPTNAVATGHVDYVLSAHQIALTLNRLSRQALS
jgi:two-component system CheB/CheR fusion protein